MDFFRTLLNPEAEEHEFPERLEIASAANILDIGEFQILEMAYRDWFGRDMPPAVVDSIFRQYMYRSIVPHWARHYARRIIAQAQRGELMPAPAIGRPPPLPPGDRQEALRRLVYIAALLLAVVIVSVLVSRGQASRVMSVLPPFFSADELAVRPHPAP